jgi:hypothetical protein
VTVKLPPGPGPSPGAVLCPAAVQADPKGIGAQGLPRVMSE